MYVGVRTHHRVSAMTVTDEVTDETEVFFGPVVASIHSAASSSREASRDGGGRSGRSATAGSRGRMTRCDKKMFFWKWGN